MNVEVQDEQLRGLNLTPGRLRLGVIPSLGEMVERLQGVAGFRIAPELKERLLAEAGE